MTTLRPATPLRPGCAAVRLAWPLRALAWSALACSALACAALASAALSAAALAATPAPATAPWTGPYKDVTRTLQQPQQRIGLPAWHRGPRDVLFWAFATGDCSAERWGSADDGIDTARFAQANVAAAVAARQPYVVSTGGALGIFTCSDDAALQAFVERYDSAWLRGLDFDIEGAQTAAQIDSLVAVLARLQVQRPALRISFTLATHASADGRGLNDTGLQVLQALRRTGLDRRAVINLMVMNYGEADARWCVLRAGRCDMGRSAVQAALNLHRQHGWPLGRIAVTAMPGENDVAGNVFTPADARHLARAARRLGLAGVHHWSIDRDQPCGAGEPRVSPACHALPGVPAGRFGQWLGGR